VMTGSITTMELDAEIVVARVAVGAELDASAESRALCR
jgi:hypothetical protein